MKYVTADAKFYSAVTNVRKFEITGRMVILSIMMGCVGSAFGVSRDPEYEYYCPRSNATFIGTNSSITLVSGPYVPFPRSLEYMGKHEGVARRSAKLTDCSKADFFCLRIEPGQGLAAMHLVLPRVIEPGRSYSFSAVDVVTQFTTSNKPYGTVVQAHLWQRIDSKEVPITLTIEKGRGVIIFDGLEFWVSPDTWPPRRQMCVLESEHGLFKDVKIAVPVERPGPVAE